MKFTRRQWLASSAITASLGAVSAYLHSPQSYSKPLPTPIFTSILDTIIPTDDTLGATDLGIDHLLTKRSQTDPHLHIAIKRLSQHLDLVSLSIYQSSFSKLSLETREKILLALLNDRTQAQLRADLTALRRQVMRLYYNSPEGHRAIAYLLPAHYPAYDSRFTKREL